MKAACSLSWGLHVFFFPLDFFCKVLWVLVFLFLKLLELLSLHYPGER